MNILYYIPDVSQEMGGIRQYAVALLKILVNNKQDHYFILHHNNDPEIMAIVNDNEQAKLVKLTSSRALKIFNKFRKYLLPSFIKSITVDEFSLGKLCKELKIEIIHCPYQYLPVAKGVKSICTMHDVQELHYPEYFSAEDRAFRAVHYLNYIKNADSIIVSYQHIKADLVKFFKITDDKVKVCLLDMENLWLDKFNEQDLSDLTYFNLPEKFLFLPSNTWEHKNHLNLFKALVQLQKQSTENITLICTGHKTDYYYSHLLPYIESNNLLDKIYFLGIVDEVTLYNLYKSCTGVVIPTLYEAGSFPLMEALLLSIPVICADTTSLPETINDDNFIFNPNDIDSISNKVFQLWNDDTFRSRSALNGKKQSYKLRNSGALNKLRSIYSELLIERNGYDKKNLKTHY